MAINKDIPTRAEAMFQNYLDKCGYTKDNTPEIQLEEMKKSFYASLSNVLLILTDRGATDQEIGRFMIDLDIDVNAFWKKYQ